MDAFLLYPLILAAGGLQAAGNSMNARLRVALVNPWLAAVVSFAPVVLLFVTLLLVRPIPLPSLDDLAGMPWWAPLGGLIGAGAVFGGLAFVDKVGAGPFNGLLITANILTSLAIDQNGWFGMQARPQGPPHWVGAALMVGGVALIALPKEGAKVAGRPLYPVILAAGALQAAAVVMNGQLNKSLVNPWLAAVVSFLPIVLSLLAILALRPLPMPAEEDVREMPWWAPLGGLAVSAAAFAGLLLVAKVGAGPFNGLLITANLATSLAIDHFGSFHMPMHRISRARVVGAVLMVIGIAMIASH